jgi:hypothetical protein
MAADLAPVPSAAVVATAWAEALLLPRSHRHRLVARRRLPESRLPHQPLPTSRLPCRTEEKSEGKEEERGREMERGGEEGADVWGPRGSHAKSVATSDKTGVKIAEGPSLHWLCKLGDALYSDFAL